MKKQTWEQVYFYLVVRGILCAVGFHVVILCYIRILYMMFFFYLIFFLPIW